MVDKLIVAACLLMFSMFIGNLPEAAASADTPVIAIKADVSVEPSLTVPLVSVPPALNGIVTPAKYAGAALVTNFFTEYTGAAARWRTEAYIARDASRLYLAFRVFAPEIKHAEFRKTSGKADDLGGEMIELFFYPGEIDRYQICASPLGARYDENNIQGKDWNGTWQSQGMVSDKFWTVEFSIPFADLGLTKLPDGYCLPANFVRSGHVLNSWTGGHGERWKSGSLLFDSAADVRPAAAPSITLKMDRWLYDSWDKQALGAVKISGLPSEARLESALFCPSNSPTPLCQQSMPIHAPCATMAINLQRLPDGEVRLACILRGTNDTELARSQAVFTKKTGPVIAPERQSRVPLTITRSVTNRMAWFINTGVPFPLGKLTDTCGVRLLTSSGQELPVQTEVRSRWRKDGPIKWLGVIFEAPADMDKVELEYGTEVKPAAIPNAIQLKETDQAYEVDTGAAKFEILKTGFNGINRIWRKDHWRRGDLTPSLRPEVRPSPQKKEEFQLVGSQEADDGPYLVNQKEERFIASGDPEVCLNVERKGPLSVTLHAEGWFIKENRKGTVNPAERLCRHSTRLTFYAGYPDVEIDQAVIITYDTRETTRLRDIGWSQKLDNPGGRLQTSFGRQAEPALIRPWNGRESVRLVQSRSDKFTIETDKEEITRGKHSAGWMAASGQSGGIQVTIRDLCALFPKELEAADQRWLVHVWPAHGKQETPVYTRLWSETNLVAREVANGLSTNAAEAAKQGLVADLTHKEIGHLWFCHTGRELDFRFPPAYQRMLLDKWLTDKREETSYAAAAGYSSGRGVAIDTQWRLHVTGPQQSAAVLEGQAAAFQDEPSACASPVWMCASDAMERFLPVDYKGPYGQFDWLNIKQFAGGVAAQEAIGDFGMFNYGDFHGDNSFWLGLDQGWALNRLWNAGHHSTPRIPWIYYVRTGDARWLKVGRRNVRHLANVDVKNYAVPIYEQKKGEFRYIFTEAAIPGAMYHCKGFVHWGGDSEIFAHLISFDPLLYSYYLTGDLRSLEVFKKWTAAVKGFVHSQPGVGWHDRDGAQSLEQLTEAYEFEWDPVLLQAIQGFVTAIFAAPAAKQVWLTYAPYFMTRYFRLTHDPAVQPWLMQWIRDCIDKGKIWAGYDVLATRLIAGSLFGETNLLASASQDFFDAFIKRMAKHYFWTQQLQIPDSHISSDPWQEALEQVSSGKFWGESYQYKFNYINVAYPIQYESLLYRAMDDAKVEFRPPINRFSGVPFGGEILIARDDTGPFTLTIEGKINNTNGIPVRLISPQGQTTEQHMAYGYNAAFPQMLAYIKRCGPAVTNFEWHSWRYGPTVPPPVLSVSNGQSGVYRLVVDESNTEFGFIQFPCLGAERQYVRLPAGKSIEFPVDSLFDIWYFRTAPDQTELHWNIGGGAGIYDLESRRFLSAKSGESRIPVKPDTVYGIFPYQYMTFLDRPLIMGLKPEDLPPAAARK